MPSAANCDFNVKRNARIDSRTITEIALAATAAKYICYTKMSEENCCYRIKVHSKGDDCVG